MDDVATTFILELFSAAGVPQHWLEPLGGERTKAMLSKDELRDGSIFILNLFDVAGARAYWVETLRGEVAAFWYDVYRRSDWVVLRTRGG